MREGIHPTYYPEAKVICSCGNTWTTGSTQELLRTDVCSECHPFFSGEQRIVDTAGQVDRFMKRLDRYSQHKAKAAKREKEQQRKSEQRFLKQQLAALDLDARLHQTLHDANIITVGHLVDKMEKDKDALLALEGIGPKTVEKLETKITEARETYFAEA